MITVIYAHPYPLRSRAGRPLLDAVRDAAGRRGALALRPLPGLRDRRRGRAARARGAPSSSSGSTRSTGTACRRCSSTGSTRCSRYGWAYGEGGAALRGKRCLWVATTGGDPTATRPRGHARAPVRRRSCRRSSRPRASAACTGSAPLVVHGAHRVGPRRAGDGGRDATASGSSATSPRRAMPRARPRDEHVLRRSTR